MSAAFDCFSRVRGIYHRRFRPGMAECERRIIDAWYDLCRATERDGADSTAARIYAQRLHDMGVFRRRAMLQGREA
ncbi:hypothetical protein [Stenotrophomonas sp. MMGLT7]|uniref:hypothetical protein n=1 Tax=Stenotrophomonas sp. MMGLT7 TaxID=2901227 RepID=UPI001E2F5019|nr:hypothetical protein [Stenotrophomonas sp. MMGLT7]MCD7099094.1 hypothetical protein [Stenotrophomonas sp. MMGLT7]